MNAIIVEDELHAANLLQKLLHEANPNIHVTHILHSVEQTVQFINNNPTPDIVFMDIQLADGLAFEIFKSVNITCPIIFTTAYDEFALKAFKVNSVDYLLKPIELHDLKNALDKIQTLKGDTLNQTDLINKLITTLQNNNKSYQSALLIPHKDKLIPVNIAQIAMFYAEDKAVFAKLIDNTNYIVPHTLDEITQMLDPKQVFKINRQFIVAKHAVKDVSIWFNGKIAVNLIVKTNERLLVSRNNTREFKKWMTDMK